MKELQALQALINKGTTGFVAAINGTHVYIATNGGLYAFPTQDIDSTQEVKSLVSSVFAALHDPVTYDFDKGVGASEEAKKDLKDIASYITSDEPDGRLVFMVMMGGEVEEICFIPESDFDTLRAEAAAHVAKVTKH